VSGTSGPLHIAIDAREAGPKPSGLARYTFNLLRGLARYGAPHRYTVLTNHPELLADLAAHPAFTLIDPGVRIVDPREQVVLPRLVDRLRPDVFHSTSMVAPVFLPRGVKRIMTLHDTIPLSFPQGFKAYERAMWAAYYGLSIRPTVRRTDRVITVSEWSRQDIVKHLDCSPDRVAVTYNWAEDHFAPPTTERVAALRARYGLPARFVLGLGSQYGYKNHDGLLVAFAKLAARVPDVDLVLKVGRPQRLVARLRQLGLERRVRFLGTVADDELPALYAAAEVFVFPSFYEGFGLPPLEAMRCGTPVIASTASSIPEVVGSAALLCPPHDSDRLAELMELALGDATLRAELRERGLAQSARFNLARGVAETLAVYDEVTGRQKAPVRPVATTDALVGMV